MQTKRLATEAQKADPDDDVLMAFGSTTLVASTDFIEPQWAPTEDHGRFGLHCDGANT